MQTQQSLDLLHAITEGSPEKRLGAWLALGASDLVHLFEEGWTLEEVFTALRVLQKTVQIVSKITRRRQFEIGALALVSRIPIPTGKHISAEERTELHHALSECIGDGWKLFVTANPSHANCDNQGRKSSSISKMPVVYLLIQKASDLRGV